MDTKKLTNKKTPGSRSHLFANFQHNFSETEVHIKYLEVNLEHVSNDTFIKVHDINTELVDNDKAYIKK